MFDQAALTKILRDFFADAEPSILANSDCHFPVIIKEGTNDFGKKVRFYFNYSGEEQTVVCKGLSGTELLSGDKVSDGDTIQLNAWGFVIIEA